MKSCFKKIIAVFAVFAIVASLSTVSVSAVEYESRVVSWWDSFIIKAVSESYDFPLLDALASNASSVFSGAACAGASPDNLHHGTFVPDGERGGIDKAGQPYVWVKCKYCGDMFKGYASDLSAAYDTYVTTLPATGYDSDGSLIWRPSSSDITDSVIYWQVAGLSYKAIKLPYAERASTYERTIDFLSSGAGIIEIFRVSDSSSRDIKYIKCYAYVTAPITGTYRVLDDCLYSCVFTNADTGSSTQLKANFGSAGSGYYTAGASVKIWDCITVPSYQNFYSYASTVYFPAYAIVPDTISSADIYNTTTRPTSITGGNYGIVGDNNQITKVEDNSSIVNETNNTYYNPATGQTSPITNWSYDYSDRSYKVTMEGGKTSTVTYGDENISITETTVNESGDTITNNYTIYYLIDGSGSENPPSTCEHTWAETSNTPATCIMPGSKLLTCSKCQQTRKEAIPALGHDWQVKQSVTTEYDETGQLTQQGYTIFECSRCHEQYKSTDGTIPPGGGSGTDPGEEDDTTIGGLIEKLLSGVGSIVGGIIKGLLSLLTKAVEALAGLAELFTTFVGSLVDLWGGFTSFLSAVFPFLPEEFVIIIELGLILVIAAAAFRKFIS